MKWKKIRGESTYLNFLCQILIKINIYLNNTINLYAHNLSMLRSSHSHTNFLLHLFAKLDFTLFISPLPYSLSLSVPFSICAIPCVLPAKICPQHFLSTSSKLNSPPPLSKLFVTETYFIDHISFNNWPLYGKYLPYRVKLKCCQISTTALLDGQFLFTGQWMEQSIWQRVLYYEEFCAFCYFYAFFLGFLGICKGNFLGSMGSWRNWDMIIFLGFNNRICNNFDDNNYIFKTISYINQILLYNSLSNILNCMCGICFVLGGAPISNHDFTNFNFFQAYLCKNNVQLNEHIIENKLLLPDSFEPAKVKHVISKRGPDHFQLTMIDMFKVIPEQAKIECLEENCVPREGVAYAFQSVLHLRGKDIYVPKTSSSHFLYNGEIWDTGILPPIENTQNDSEWFHQRLLECKGSREKIAQMLQQIRGDFAFLFIEADDIFIGKDYFGKRSLLLGMGENYFVVTSAPIHNLNRVALQDNQADEGQGDDENPQNEESWRQKYEAEWLSSKSKYYFEIPSNTLINISREKSGRLVWFGENIQKFDLAEIPKQVEALTQQTIVANVKKLMIQSLKEVTRCIYEIGQTPETKIAVLFSGGIDSTLIARLLDFVLPKNETIDLVNLAFRADAPDRQSGLEAYKQLKNLSPHRNYNLILLDKKLQDIEVVKPELLQSIYPKSTHMDFNIAGALNVAVTGTKSRIILTGLGADEIFSGYSRYRIAFKRAGLEELEREMIFDMERLWIRNLGRDDRSIGSMAKEVRYPFLYLPLWVYLRQLPTNLITEGSGEKKLLRKVAQEFGLEVSSKFKKRAIQFGTRLAKLSNVKCFGSNRKAKGTSQYQ